MLEERARWAMRIHDGLTQSVTSAVLELQALRTRILADPAGAVASLSGVEAAIRADLARGPPDAVRALRGSAPAASRRSRTFIDELLARWGLPARVTIEGDVDAVPPSGPGDGARRARGVAHERREARGNARRRRAGGRRTRLAADRGRGPRTWDRGRRGRRSAFRAPHDAGPRRGDRRNPGYRIDARGRDPRRRAPSRRRARRGTMRILIVDDHALVRRGMAYVVKEGFPDADVVGGRGRRCGARRDAEQGRRPGARRRPDAGPRRAGAAARDEARVAGRSR